MRRGRRVGMRRYTLISTITGALDFLLALVLLHLGFSAPLSLGVSIFIAGIADYFALEWWGFPGRKGVFSPRRLLTSGAVEAGTYGIRMAALWMWKTHFSEIEPTEHFVGLAVAYAIAFLFGYLARRNMIFTRTV